MNIPLSGSNIRLLTGIKWRNDYKHTRYFTNVQQQTNWFMSQTTPKIISQANFVRVDESYALNVPYHIDSLWNINYMMFQNTAYQSKWFYCFVTKLEYVNKNMTKVYFQIDVYQTWYLSTTFQPSYIERQHTTEYVNGIPSINTIEEGLDYGTMYDTIKVEQVKPSGEVMFLVVVTKQILDEADTNSEEGFTEASGEITPIVNGSPQPLTFYILPFLRSGEVPEVTPYGVSPVDMVLKLMYKAQSAVNNIVSIYTTDYIGLNNASGSSAYMNPEYFERVTVRNNAQSVGLYRLKNIYSYETKTIQVSSKYPIVNTNQPSKLYMSPYYKVFLDDFQGNRVEIKPEYINSNNISIKVKGSIGTSNKVSYEVLAYNYGVSEPYTDQVGLEYGLINSNPNDVPIITDLLAAYLQGNKNSLEVQTNQILFNSLTGIIGGAGSTITAGLNRDAGGAVGGLNGSLQSTASGIFALQGIQAKQKDIDNTPPSITNMGGNNYYTMGNGYRGVYVVFKRIKEEYQEVLGWFFRKYGYKWNRIGIPNFNTRYSYNFVKTIDCLITGNAPQEMIIPLQNIFDNGITLWHTDDIGNYNLTNGVK